MSDTLKPTVCYGLGSVDGTQFWVGNVRSPSPPRYDRRSPDATAFSHWVHPFWTPTFSTKPKLWSRKKALENLKTYNIERMLSAVPYSGGRKCRPHMPELQLIKFEITQTNMGAEQADIDYDDMFMDIVHERIDRIIGGDCSMAFKKMAAMLEYDKEKIQEYRYAIKRKKSTLAVVNEQMPEAISYGGFTVMKTETDLVFSRMLLADKLVGHYDLLPLYDVNKMVDNLDFKV